MEEQRNCFEVLESALQQYHLRSVDSPIRVKNILDELEFRFTEFTEEQDSSIRLTNFFDVFFEKLRKTECLPAYFNFWEYALLQFVDLYFQKQIEHHGFHILAAQEILNDPEMLENPEYWLNSAHPKDVATVDYYQNLLACQTLWCELSAEARQKAEEMCFPLPVRV